MTPDVSELAADGPRAIEPELALRAARDLGTFELDGRSLAFEFWIRDAKGPILSYGGEALELSADDGGLFVGVDILGYRFDLPPGDWHHVGVSFDVPRDVAVITVDGIASPLAPLELPAGAHLSIGGEGASGTIQGLAIYDRALHPSVFLGHVLVAAGVRPPIRPESELPFTVQLQTGHSETVDALAVSPDGRLVASGSADTTVRLWEVASGRELRAIADSQREINELAFAADGRTVLSASCSSKEMIYCEDGGSALRVHEVATGALVRQIEVPGGFVRAMVPTPDGRAVWTNSMDGKLRLFDLADGALLFDADEPMATYNMAISADGERLVLGGDAVCIWDARARERVGYAEVADIVDASVFPGASTSVVVGLRNGEIREISVYTGEVLSSVAPFGDYGGIEGLGGTDGLLVSIDANGSLATHDLGTGETISRQVAGEAGRVVWTAEGPLTAGTGPMRLWGNSGPIREFGGRALNVIDASFSPDGRSIVTSSGFDGDLRVWDLNELRATRRFAGDGHAVDALAFSRDGTTLYEGSEGAVHARSWPGGDGRHAVAPGADMDLIRAIAPSPDGQRLAIGMTAGVRIVDASGSATYTTDGKTVTGVAWSPDGTRLLSGSANRTATIWDAATMKPIRTLAGHDKWVFDVAFLADGRALTSSWDGTVKLWNADTGEVVRTLTGHTDAIETFAVSPDGKQLLTGSRDRTARVFDLETGETLAVYLGHTAWISSVGWSADGKLAMTASEDGTVRLWNRATGASAILVSAGDAWIVVSPDGTFDASPDGTVLVAVVRGVHGYGVDQFALTSNRPDRLMEQLGVGSTAARDHYRALWERRMRKAGFIAEDLASTDLPDVRITDVRVSGRSAQIDVEATSASGLRYVQIWADGVPIGPGLGFEAEGTRLRKTFDVELVGGSQTLEVSAIGRSGRESPRAAALAASEVETPGTLWYVGFGVSAYENPGLNDLTWADQDARDLAASFGRARGFADVKTRIFTDGEVTLDAIRAARAELAATRPEDTVVLFVAGHGVHGGSSGSTYFYLTAGADPANLDATAADFELIEDVLDGIPARRKLFLLDTCQSGEDTGAAPALVADARGVPMASRAVRGAAVAYAAGAAPWIGPRDRFIDVDLHRRTGAVVFSSSLGTESSLESDAWANGAFTEALLAGLAGAADANRDKTVSVAELRAYVIHDVPVITRGMQHPTVDRDNVHASFGFRYKKRR